MSAGMVMMLSASAGAQTPADPNPGNITLTAGIDFPSTYVFRGIVQETDPKITMQPYGDFGLALFSGDGGVKSVALNFGIWNSLHSGSSGTDGSTGKRWYEEDFYTTLSLGFGGGTTLATTFTAYTSPIGTWGPVKELMFKVSVANRFAPYGLVAFELGDEDAPGADGVNPGNYLELGVGPNWPLGGGRATVAIPVKLGMSLGDYYELGGEDHKFGFFDIGALFTVPLSGVSSGFGAWNLHGGVDWLKFGDTTKAFNGDDGSKVIGSVGIGLSY